MTKKEKESRKDLNKIICYKDVNGVARKVVADGYDDIDIRAGKKLETRIQDTDVEVHNTNSILAHVLKRGEELSCVFISENDGLVIHADFADNGEIEQVGIKLPHNSVKEYYGEGLDTMMEHTRYMSKEVAQKLRSEFLKRYANEKNN